MRHILNDMKALLDRKWKKDTYTIGRFYIDGEFFSNSMEDRDRGLRQDMNVGEIERIKVYGETAIPTGKYIVTMTYSPKYKRVMPQIMNVPGWTGVRIHSMNTAEDSLGCIGLGNNTKAGWISESRATCKKFEDLLVKAGGTCELEIV